MEMPPGAFDGVVAGQDSGSEKRLLEHENEFAGRRRGIEISGNALSWDAESEHLSKKRIDSNGLEYARGEVAHKRFRRTDEFFMIHSRIGTSRITALRHDGPAGHYTLIPLIYPNLAAQTYVLLLV
jgi:hypothetical protein